MALNPEDALQQVQELLRWDNVADVAEVSHGRLSIALKSPATCVELDADLAGAIVDALTKWPR